MRITGIDIGNSSIKLCGFEGAAIAAAANVGGDINEAARWSDEFGAEGVAFCSTRNLTAEERETAARNGWWELTYESALPIRIEYATPRTLGMDRLAAAMGAYGEFAGRSFLVADVGTALTLDLVDAEGRFMGGNISPGIMMRLEALHKFTSRLPLVAPEGSLPLLGYDTDTAIRSGVKRGVINEILGTCCMANREYGCDLVVLTGGGAKDITDLLEESLKTLSDAAIKIKVDDNLVEKGLKEAYKYNHEEN